MTIPLLTRIKGFISRDKYSFWFNHFTDEEKKLALMDAWQLASIIKDAGVRRDMEQKRIIAEHMLNVRLAKIQATASWGAGILAFVGAIIGASMSVALTSIAHDNQRSNYEIHIPEKNNNEKHISEPVEDNGKKKINPPKAVPSNQVIKVPSTSKPIIKQPSNATNN